MSSTEGTSTAQPTAAIQIKPNNRAILKTLKDLEVCKAHANHHSGLITEAISMGKSIPGLRRDVRPQIPDVPIDLAVKWEEAHIAFTDSLTALLSEYWSKKQETIDKEIADITHRLTLNGTGNEETDHIKTVTAEAGATEAAKLLAPKPQRQRLWKKPNKRLKPGDDSPRAINTGN
jgi:hypothetical protein